MANFLEILAKPDNLPIAAMVLGLAYLLWVWARQARRNDELIRSGRKKEIGREMRR